MAPFEAFASSRFNRILIKPFPFVYPEIPGEGLCPIVDDNKDFLPFLFEELISFGVMEIAIPHSSEVEQTVKDLPYLIKSRVQTLRKWKKTKFLLDSFLSPASSQAS